MYGARLGCWTRLFTHPSSMGSDPVWMSLVSPKRKTHLVSLTLVIYMQSGVFGLKRCQGVKEMMAEPKQPRGQSCLGFCDWSVMHLRKLRKGQHLPEGQVTQGITALLAEVASSCLCSYKITAGALGEEDRNTDTELELIAPFWGMR